MEISDFITTVVGVLTIVGLNMMLFGLLACMGDDERIPRILIKYGGYIMLLVINILICVFFYLGVTEGFTNTDTENNCRVMFNIY